MSKSVLFLKDEKKRLTAVITSIPDWDGFDKLIKYLEINYQSIILESYDGPGARRWVLEVDGKKIELIHDNGYGNYLLSQAPENEDIIKEIGNDLEERLKDI